MSALQKNQPKILERSASQDRKKEENEQQHTPSLLNLLFKLKLKIFSHRWLN